MKCLVQLALRQISFVAAFFRTVGPASRIASDLRQGRNPRDADMRILDITDVCLAFRAAQNLAALKVDDQKPDAWHVPAWADDNRRAKIGSKNLRTGSGGELQPLEQAS